MAVSVTNSSPLVDTATTATKCAATATGVNGAEVFTFTPTVADAQYAILMDNAAADQGTITWSLAAGGFWNTDAVLTGSILQSVKQLLILDAKYKSAAGTFVITFTPASGKRLLTDHTFAVYALQMPF